MFLFPPCVYANSCRQLTVHPDSLGALTIGLLGLKKQIPHNVLQRAFYPIMSCYICWAGTTQHSHTLKQWLLYLGYAQIY